MRDEYIKDYLFRRDFWVMDLIATSVVAMVLGYYFQVIADSGGKFPSHILRAIVQIFVPYLMIFVCRRLLRDMKQSWNSWLWLGIAGSLLVGFYIHIVDRLIVQSLFSTNASTPTIGYLGLSFAGMFFDFLLCSVASLLLIFSFRFVLYVFNTTTRRVFGAKN